MGLRSSLVMLSLSCTLLSVVNDIQGTFTQTHLALLVTRNLSDRSFFGLMELAISGEFLESRNRSRVL
jgi:hypothetical protein